MRCIGKNTTYIIALFAAFAMLTGFSLTGSESLFTKISSPEKEDALFELVYNFPEQTVEPAILNNVEESDPSIFRFANQRFFDPFGPADPVCASCFSYLLSHSTQGSPANKNDIQLKLRI